MAESAESSDLSSPRSEDYDDHLSPTTASPRPSVDHTGTDIDHLPPPSKRRKTGNSSTHLVSFERAPSSQPEADADETLSVSEDGFSDVPGSPVHDEWAIRDEAQTDCLWRDCDFGRALNNDELVQHVQGTHCATGGPKRTKYVCEWGECQKKASNHPSGYALKAHMRSHTKEKPYYCALPECDKAFTRSDALAKHMRTVHEPEPVRGGGLNPDMASLSKKSVKLKLSNGTSTQKIPTTPADTPAYLGPAYDEDGNEVDPSPTNDNITYIPAHHPITGQPGFMIHYPPDIHFSAWESSIQADELMRLLRRQIKWAEDEGKALEKENATLETLRREEWVLKEILIEGVMESELVRAQREGIADQVSERVLRAMERDLQHSEHIVWKGKKPSLPRRRRKTKVAVKVENPEPELASPPAVVDEDDEDEDAPSPPPTGASGGFDGDDDPYDNYVNELYQRFKGKRDQSPGDAMALSEPEATQLVGEDARADAANGLMEMSGGSR